MSGDVAQADAQSDATISSAELPSTFVDGFHELEEVKHMKYREMPHYGLVSIISFGASGLGGMFTEGKGTGLTDASAENAIGDPALWFAEESEEDIEHAKEVVLSCLKAGVNLIDTAHWYGQGRSERLLGHALADVPRAAYYINTKIGRYEKSTLGMFDFSYEKTYQAALDSLKRLRVECVDSMQVHDPEFAPSIEVILEETLPALQQLKSEGKIRLIGVTGYPLALQQEIITRSGVGIDSSLSYCHYSLNDTTLESSGFVAFCKERNVALINASPISMGLLMERDPPDWHPASAETKALCRLAVDYCKRAHVDISKLALHFSLGNEQVATTLISSTSAERMRSNLSAVNEKLSVFETAALTHLREKIFKPAGTQSWEGVEIASYWRKAGPALMSERLYKKRRI